MAYERAGGVCGKCGSSLSGCKWEVHHWTYDRVGHEDLKDLAAIHEECHRSLHPEKVRSQKVGELVRRKRG